MIKKRFQYFVTLLIIIAVASLFNSCRTFIWSNEKIDLFFADAEFKPTQHQIVVEGKTMNYAEIGFDSLPVVVFIHGSPGSWSAFAGFMKDTLLLQKVKMVAVDRIGFGHSEHGKRIRSLALQAAYLKPILQKFKKQNLKLILVGHSLGGPLVAKLAMDYPELVDQIIIVAGAICPDLEPHQNWFRFPLNLPPFCYFASKTIRASNYELLHLKKELTAIKPYWKNIHQPVTVIQGSKDHLVSPKNVDYAKKMIINSSKLNFVIEKNMGHDVPWAYPQLINHAIIEALDISSLHSYIIK